MIENSDVKVAGLLLAAGGSRRMGTPKQLLEFEGKTLLRRAAEALIDAGCEPVVVVLGAAADQCLDEVSDLDVLIVENRQWKSGMSSSIRKGIDTVEAFAPEASGVMITLCDQPVVTAEKIALFIDEFSRGDSAIVTAGYHGVLGVPALFAKTLFGDLLGLEGDAGARDLIRNYPDAIAINLPEAEFDLDTLDDVKERGQARLPD